MAVEVGMAVALLLFVSDVTSSIKVRAVPPGRPVSEEPLSMSSGGNLPHISHSKSKNLPSSTSGSALDGEWKPAEPSMASFYLATMDDLDGRGDIRDKQEQSDGHPDLDSNRHILIRCGKLQSADRAVKCCFSGGHMILTSSESCCITIARGAGTIQRLACNRVRVKATRNS